MSGFIATLTTQTERTTRAHGHQLALVTNGELSLLKPRYNKRCGWKRALFLTRAVMGTLKSVSFILCANSTPFGQSITFFRSRRSRICSCNWDSPVVPGWKITYVSCAFGWSHRFSTLQPTLPCYLYHYSPRKECLKAMSLCLAS